MFIPNLFLSLALDSSTDEKTDAQQFNIRREFSRIRWPDPRPGESQEVGPGGWPAGGAAAAAAAAAANWSPLITRLIFEI